MTIVRWSPEEIEDLMADAIGDSFEMDWTARDGARAVMRELEACGLHITWTPAREAALMHRELAAKEPLPDVAAAHIRFAEEHERKAK